MRDNMIYMDNAATSLIKPECVYDAFIKASQSSGNMGRGVSRFSIETSKAVFAAREEIASLFHIGNALRIGFTKNATEALNTGICGLLKKGDHAITTVCDHNSVLRPLFCMEKDAGVSVTAVECDGNGDVSPDDVRAVIRPNTKLIVMTHVSNVTGTVFDIETIGRIAKENDIAFFLDVTQSAGVLDIDVERMNIDMLAFSAHKYLFSFQGLGGLYVREDLKLKALMLGGSTFDSAELYPEPDMPELTEAGTQNMPGILSLKESVRYIKENHDLIQTKETELIRHFLTRIKEISWLRLIGRQNETQRTAVFSMISERFDIHDIAAYLEDRYGIVVRVGLHCAPLIHSRIGSGKTGTLRISLSYFNETSQIDTLMEGFKTFEQTSSL